MDRRRLERLADDGQGLTVLTLRWRSAPGL